MTGATSGLGVPAALHILKNGAKLIVLYRDEKNLAALQGKGDLIGIQADLSSVESVLAACARIKEKVNKIDILINNAGLWVFGPRQETNEGKEMTFMVNLLAPYMLIKELTPLLDASGQPRIINTASALHQGTIDFNDIELKHSFSGFNAYRQSKLGLVLLTRQLAIIHPAWKIVSLHPGVINTNRGRSNWLGNLFFKFFGRSPEKGAETLITLVEKPFTALTSGAYYADSKEKSTLTKESKDMAAAARLVQVLEGYASQR